MCSSVELLQRRSELRTSERIYFTDDSSFTPSKLTATHYFQHRSVKLKTPSLFLCHRSERLSAADQHARDDNQQNGKLESVYTHRWDCFLNFQSVFFVSLITTGSLDCNLLKATFVSIVLIVRLVARLFHPPVWTAPWATGGSRSLKSEKENCCCVCSLFYFWRSWWSNWADCGCDVSEEIRVILT